MIVVAVSVSAEAKKIPGYMGLKFLLQYQGGISPQWNDFKQSYRPYLYHNVQADYVITRKHSIGLQYTRFDYSSAFGKNRYDYATDGTVSFSNRRISANTVGIYVKFFRSNKGFIAPLGRYIILGLNYQMTTDHLQATVPTNYGSDSYNRNLKVVSHDVAFRFGMGRNIIIANRLLISVEGDVNIPLSTGIRAGIAGSALSTNSSPDAVYKYVNAVDAMLSNLLQIKIGIGALVF